MATEREDFLNDLTGNDQSDADDNSNEQVDQDDHETDDQGNAAEEVSEPSPTQGEGAAALLDSISEPDPNAAPKEDVAPKDEVDPEADPKAKAEAKPKTLEEEEAEALEGIKSERGRERVQATFAKLKETEGVKQQLEQDINEFKTMVQSTKMQPDEFAAMLEFGRLSNAGGETEARLALQMLDDQREALCKRLGIEAPGVDPLSDFPELKEAVDNMEITKEHALKLAKYQRQDNNQQQAQQLQQAQQQSFQQSQQVIAEVGRTAEAYFATRKHEVDYAPKVRRIEDYFKDPAKIQEFASTYEPKQWLAQLKFMYDNISVAPAQQKKAPQPIRSRSMLSGAPSTNSQASPEDRIMGHLESLGL